MSDSNLDILLHYDREKNASPYKTLRIYTRTGFNKIKTAELMFLHRNTVIYRIQQIEDLCGIDPFPYGFAVSAANVIFN